VGDLPLRKLKPYIILLLKYAFAIFILHWVGSFSWMATVALLVFLPVGQSWSTPPPPRVDTSHFEPYEVHLNPHIGRMLVALGLMTDQQWKEIVGQEYPTDPWSAWRLVNYGVRGVVISCREDGEELVHWSPTGHYTASVEYTCRLDFLKLPAKYLEWSPEYFFRLDKDGYHQGISVHESWWDKHKDSIQAKGLIKNVRDGDRIIYGRVHLSLSVFPQEAFWIHSRGWSAELNDIVRKRAEELEWKFGDDGDDLEPDFGPSVDYFENEYGNVALRLIERDR
jgi:hypothetical protein